MKGEGVKNTQNFSERPKPEFSAETRTGTEIISVRFRFGNSYRNRNGHFTTNIQLLITHSMGKVDCDEL